MSIKINELMVGNLIYAKPNNTSVKVGVHNIEQISGKLHIYEGIAITTEYLESKGFKPYSKQHKGDNKILYLKSEADGIGFCYNKIDGDWETWLLNCDYDLRYMPRWVRFVHEIQNLYFLLSSGKEL